MAVTGILIVVALMLAIQIDRVVETTSPDRLSTDREPELENAVELGLLEKTVAELKMALELLQGAARKTESEAELLAEITRTEERVLRLSSRVSPSGTPVTDNADINHISSKAAEILRLREEIRLSQDAISRFTRSVSDAGEKLRDLEIKIREMEALVAAARAENRNLRLIRELSDTTKEPVIVDVRGQILRIMRFDQPHVIEVSATPEFHDALRGFRKQDQYFVLYFRPSGASRFEELRNVVRKSGFELGYDAISENADLTLGKEDDS